MFDNDLLEDIVELELMEDMLGSRSLNRGSRYNHPSYGNQGYGRRTDSFALDLLEAEVAVDLIEDLF